MNQTPPTPKKNHSALILSLFAVIIIGPMLFAWVLFQKNDHFQLKLSNHGDLLSPPANISNTPFYDLQKKQNITGDALLQGKWWLVYIGPDKCYHECQNTLYNMRQLRLSLGKNTSRLERLFVPHPGCPITICEQYLNEFYPDMLRAKMEPVDFM